MLDERTSAASPYGVVERVKERVADAVRSDSDGDRDSNSDSDSEG